MMSDPVNPAERDDRPWEQPGAFRLDCEPHRGDLIRGLGRCAQVTCVAGLCLPGLLPLPLGLGLAAWLLARRDLREMDASRRDPAGRAATRDGQKRGLDAVWSAAFLVMLWALVAAAALLGRHAR
jgi:hypothetical protein